ncbi:AAA+-type ATPase, SpoVK/Ycf46/Vps4 family [Abditibacterium utsteinense]|uniref:AAA+-type ATPase, SpoVK/Ycf46/Vps4 family n=1 Tax=Abditibacterium utsteinense TaxID=1960156 RepID=A0A2S8STQ8_9BACT|nr:ATP-binding protein [Abditibacterium utsteinense]PQV64166.1 AAA+-type ATPase, SpoVK/Ycf46/Vps4 family [Abditibacterium utsteinense]
MNLPDWAREIASRYESGANNQFLLHGNVEDRFVLPDSDSLGTLGDFLSRALLGRFDVVLSYDLGAGIRIDKGNQIFAQWPAFKSNPNLPREPRPALETLTHYARFCANLARLGQSAPRLAVVVRAAQLVAPQSPSIDPQFGALALLLREWSLDSLLHESQFASFLIAENLSDLHPLAANNPRAAQFKIPLPSPLEVRGALKNLAPQFPRALQNFTEKLDVLSGTMAGASLSSLETLLKTREYEAKPLENSDLVQLKKQLIENDAGGLIEFVESNRTLEDYSGADAIKKWLRADLELWRQGDLAALPMGYLLCGPVGTGKTFLVECLAGEAGVPIVKIKNFRDKWIGSTEGNLEKIFRLLGALGRCYVFIDEADQSLGKRDAGNGDSGISGRVYGMFAQEMARGSNRGKIIWILASSRPDLIEVDLKRPGRIDVKIPIFPTTTARESFDLIRSLCKRRDMEIAETEFESLEKTLPILLTPGAAEALAVKVYRASKVEKRAPTEVLRESLQDYQAPIDPQILAHQMELAIREASDLEFVPASLRK